MHMADHLAVHLDVEIPSIGIHFLRNSGRPALVLYLLTVPVLHVQRVHLAVGARDLLIERVQPCGFGIDAGTGLWWRPWVELRLCNIERPGADDRVCGVGRTGNENRPKQDECESLFHKWDPPERFAIRIRCKLTRARPNS